MLTGSSHLSGRATVPKTCYGCDEGSGDQMKLFRETTVWKGCQQANHVYALSDDKQWMYGYVKQGTSVLIEMNKRIRFDTRYRTFKEIKRGQDV